MDRLDIITELSHEFGSPQFVKGGGGNTSCKDETTLWVKPSGTTLAGLTRDTFVAMDRASIAELYTAEAPEEATAREAFVKDRMAAAVVPGSSGRPSVEAPLHNAFDTAYVVHTHPALVNGMTCAREGRAACAQLFPEALWVPFTDPGYKLSLRVREDIEAYKRERDGEPSLVFLENHGVFAAADTPEAMRDLYDGMMDVLRAAYDAAGVSTVFTVGDGPAAEQVEQQTALLREVLGAEATFVCHSGPFPLWQGPVSPDHVVYAKSYAFCDELTAANLAAYGEQHGYAPRVVAADGVVYGVGTTESNARLALEFAQDGSEVMQLTQAFGGIQYMSDAAREFIEHWEVESYRSKVAEQGLAKGNNG